MVFVAGVGAAALGDDGLDRLLSVSRQYPPTSQATTLELGDALAAAVEAGRLASASDLRAMQQQVRRVVRRAQLATVAIELNDSLGSGVIVSDDGLVLTAGHVTVEPNRGLWVRLPDGRRFRGRSLGLSHRDDSGLVKIIADAPDEVWPAAPVATEAAEVGDWVVALGHPNGYVEGRRPPVRLGRVLMYEDGSLSTDATLVGGDSGGPLLNLRGEVVGIHSRIGERITSNFHVPIECYAEHWPRLAGGLMTGAPEGQDPSRGRPSIGVAVAMRAAGCYVTQLFPRSPAAQAGLRVGDRLVRVGDAEVTSIPQLARVLSRVEPYDRLTLTIEREADSSEPSVLEKTVWLGRVDRSFPGLAMETPLRADSYGGGTP
ncbi:MAG: trypsin-like peptidase domain-containing protein [Planctomycetota bacterium]